ncbi:MAG: lanthionine synthetase LanC family protein [Acidobacteriota bacterium]
MAPLNLLDSAEKIGNDLLRKAQSLPDGSMTWGHDTDHLRRPVVDSGLFNGRCGQAVALALLYHATRRQKFRDHSLRALGGILQGLERNAFGAATERLSLGLAGLGGMIYALVYIAQILEEDDLLYAAAQLSEFLTPRRIASDQELDVLLGSAGALLSQLALAKATARSPGVDARQAMTRAEGCAQHLLTHRSTDPETGLPVWATLQGERWTGFSHGAAGIAHALLRYCDRTGDQTCYQAGLDAFAFERSLFSKNLGNWLQTRRASDEEPRFWSWCHGAPGIALSRLKSLGGLKAEDQGPVVQDLLEALHATAHIQRTNIDTLCCGYFGRIDILLEAGCCLDNPSLIRQAERLTGLCLERAESHSFEIGRVFTRPGQTDRGLFQGLSGIAYSMLRLGAPESFPCVLSLD